MSDRENVRRFDVQFKRLCVRFGVNAAYYIPRWNEDKTAVLGGTSGGERDACVVLDTVMKAGADAIRRRYEP